MGLGAKIKVFSLNKAYSHQDSHLIEFTGLCICPWGIAAHSWRRSLLWVCKSYVLINMFIYCPAKNIQKVLNAWQIQRHWRPLKSLNSIQLQEVVNKPRIVVLKDDILAHLT